MTRRRLLLLASALVLVLAACGEGIEENGGGADVSVSDTKPDTGDSTDTTASTDTTVADNGDIPPGQDPRNILGDDEDLNDLANACFEGDMGACDDLFAQTPVDSDLEVYSQTCGGRIDEVEGSPDCAARFAAGEAQVPGDFNDAEFDALAADCFDGDFAACDELFRVTPVDSAAEAYGDTCGGRLEDGVRGSCEELLGASD